MPRIGPLARLLGRRRGDAAERLTDDGSLVLAGRALDVERGDAVALAEIVAAGFDLSRPMLVRHLFSVRPDADIGALVGGLQAEGYEVDSPAPDQLRASASAALTVLAAAQMRARMTGLATRHPVDYLGWEALAPPRSGNLRSTIRR